MSMETVGICTICNTQVYSNAAIEGLQPKELTKCHHLFHKSCINEWLSLINRCPICTVIQNEVKPVKETKTTKTERNKAQEKPEQDVKPIEVSTEKCLFQKQYKIKHIEVPILPEEIVSPSENDNDPLLETACKVNKLAYDFFSDKK
jgi:hypothetical protein